MNPIILLLVSVGIFIAYNTFVFLRYGQEPSISDSWYRLTLADKWLFTLATWGYVVPMLLLVLTNGGIEWHKYVFYAAAVLLILVGIFPDFKVKAERPWHVVGAEGGIATAMVWGLICGFWYVAIPFFIYTWLMMRNNIRNHTYWIEIVAYFSVVLMLWFKYVLFQSMVVQ